MLVAVVVARSWCDLALAECAGGIADQELLIVEIEVHGRMRIMPEGTIYSLTWIHSRDQQPYNIALVDLDGGGRVMSRIRGSEPAIGQRVTRAEEDGVAVFDVATDTGDAA